MTDPGADVVPPSVRVAAAWSWRVLVIAAGLALLFWLLAYFKVLVVAVAIAVLLAVLLAPVVRLLVDVARFPRVLAVAVAVLGLVAFVVGLVTVAGNSIAEGFGELRAQALAGFDELIDWLSDGPLALTAVQLEDYVGQLSDWATTNSSTLVSGALSVTTTVGHVAAGALITLFCTFFFLHDGGTIWSWLVGLLPRGARRAAHQAGRRGLVTLGGYTRTQILVAFVDAVGIGVGALILQVPLALPLAALVFVGAFIPIVGAVVTGTVAALVALVAQGPVVALLMLGVVLLVQQIEGHILQPLLMGHAVSLHPVAVLLAVAAGSFAAGIVGALFAVPLVAVLNTVILYLHGHDKFPALGSDDHFELRAPAVDTGPERVGT
ncbi:AI-2E family transporter [Cellulomonas sp. ATA003]|uniref:AI-2E family transporter n=1 Tax=Cellulomonas sp. ATA003 TaxID=3073064 RepID=UPI002873EBDD|nr:AI-2E family transporter [Cellulomonas sp. ATA003]WNB85039.1 AI-2E family transporter [Cellulomonas sp. ATA003]